MQIHAVYLINVLMLFGSFSASSQGMSPRQLDSLVQRNMRVFHVPGIAIGIIKDGNVIFSKGYGVRSLRTQKPVTSQTLFGIASNTKAFTAAALGILVDEGKLRWDDKVSQYIPEFKLYDPYATKEITIRDLLSHRSGLGTGTGDLMHDPDSTDFTTQEIIYNLRYLKPASSFRSRFAYYNNLYIVAGEIIARLTKTSWENFVETRIMRPLGMNQSAASYQGCRTNPNIIDAHRRIADSVRVIARYGSMKVDPAGGIYSSVEEMSQWLLMLMNHGRYSPNLDKQLITESTVAEMWTPQTIIPVYKTNIYRTHFAAYGLGWFIDDVKGYKEIWHTGQDVGMVSAVSIIPELNLGIIVLTNQESGAVNPIMNQITDSYVGIDGLDRTAEAFERSQASEKSSTQLRDSIWQEVSRQQVRLPVNSGMYTGTYHDKWFGKVSIQVRQNQLWFAAQRSPQLRGYLFPFKKNTFVIRWQNPEFNADAFVLFKTTLKGKTTELTLESITPNGGINFTNLTFHR